MIDPIILVIPAALAVASILRHACEAHPMMRVVTDIHERCAVNRPDGTTVCSVCGKFLRHWRNPDDPVLHRPPRGRGAVRRAVPARVEVDG